MMNLARHLDPSQATCAGAPLVCRHIADGGTRVITLDEALVRTAAEARALGDEWIPIDEAYDRLLAEPVKARGMAPRAALSAMDGYAVIEADLADAPVRLPVVTSIFAGDAEPTPLEPGTCARIFTGAPVPAGADRVVVQEDVQAVDGAAVFDRPGAGGRHIRAAGSDFAAGASLLAAGHRLGARAMIAAAAADRDRLLVFRRPRVAILSTGDELTAPGQALEVPGAIPDSVSFGVAGMVRDWGGQLVRREKLGDAPELLREAADLALAEADVVVVTGGASVGERDFAHLMFEAHRPEAVFTKVAIKPGKPVWMARAGARRIVGLPGNPTSAMVTARLFLAPLLAGLAGRDPADAMMWRSAALATPLGPAGPRETLERARWDDGRAAVLKTADSGAQAALIDADILVRRPAFSPAAQAGETVLVLEF